MRNTHNLLLRLVVTIGIIITLANIPAAAQDKSTEKWNTRDLEGIWLNSLLDITDGMGRWFTKQT